MLCWSETEEPTPTNQTATEHPVTQRPKHVTQPYQQSVKQPLVLVATN